MARTNIDLDDELLTLVMRRYGVFTKTEAVDLALRHLAGRPLTVDEALGMRGANAMLHVPADPALDEL
jgi:Arc/MetJ family transcription regulator